MCSWSSSKTAVILYSTLGKTLKTIEATHHPLAAPLYMPWTAKEPPELCTIFFNYSLFVI